MTGAANWSNVTKNSPATSGAYGWRIYVNDTSGNWNVTGIQNITVQNQAPGLTLSLPTNNTQFNDTQDINFNFTSTDDQNATLSCGIYLDNVLNDTDGAVANNTLKNFLISGISYGNHNWSVNCTDGALNNVSEVRLFVIADTIAPTITINNPADNTIYNNATQLVNISSSDSGSGINLTWYNWNGTNYTYTSEENVTFAEENNTLIAYVNDTSGNENSTNVTFTVDTTKPNITILGCSPSVVKINNSTICNATITDIRLETITANVTMPNSTAIIASVSNVSDNYYLEFNGTEIEGQYNVTWLANDTVGNLAAANDSFDVFYFPSVIIEYPHNETFYRRHAVPISINATDVHGIDAEIAQITFPNSTSLNITLGPGLQSDNFDSNTMNAEWQAQEKIGSSQTCVQDIDNSVSGKAFTSISGNGTPRTDTVCDIWSNKKIDGDFDINISFNILNSLEPDTALNLIIADYNHSFASREIFIALANFTGYEQEYEIFASDGNFSDYILLRPTTDTSGKLRIKREGNNFTFYTWNNTASSWTEENVSQNEFNMSRTLYVAFETESAYPEFGSLNVSWDDFNALSNNFSFGEIIAPLVGNYNVSIFANSTLGIVNDTEKTTFNVIEFDYPPSTPWILAPLSNSVVSGIQDIIWSDVYDEENDELKFNITFFNLDSGVNYTISDYGNTSTTTYSWNTSDYPDGKYDIEVLVFENESPGTNNRYNVTNITVHNTAPQITLNSPDDNAEFEAYNPQTIDFNFTAVSTFSSVLNCSLYINNTLIATNDSTSNNTLTNLSLEGSFLGLYNWSVNCSDGTFSNVSETRNILVNDTIIPTWSNNATSPASGANYSPSQIYQFNITWNDNYVIDTAIFELNGSNTTLIESGENTSFDAFINFTGLPAGNYTYRWYAKDYSDNWNASDIYNYTINPAESILNLSASPSWNEVYGTLTNVSCNSSVPAVNVSLWRNDAFIGSSIGGIVSDAGVLVAGEYNYTCNNSESNYSANSTSNILNISKADDFVDLYINGNLNQNVSVNYSQTNATGNSTSNTTTLYRNGSLTDNPDITTLAAGLYEYKVNSTGNENYSANSTGATYYLNVSKAASEVNLALNGSDSNITVNVSDFVDINATLITPTSGDLDLYIDNNLNSSGGSNIIYNVTYYNHGEYNITAVYNETENYTSGYETHWLNVVDTVPPNITINSPLNQIYDNETQLVDISANDTDSVDKIWYE
jgi:hypothetical protein